MAADAATGIEPMQPLLAQGGLDTSALHGAAERIAARHAAAPPGDFAAFRMRIEALATNAALQAELARQMPHMIRRAANRRVRDLPGMGSQDVLFDLAGTVAALLGAGHAADANSLANRYLDARPQGATGWALLPLFVALRLREQDAQDPAAPRLDTLLAAASPRLVAIGGLSGTGKSTLARLLGCRLGRMPGARVLRSDVFRKRLAGLPPETRLPPRHYTRRSDQETFEAMFESADDHLACGSSVILDAVFMNRSERDVAEALAERARVPFSGFWLEAPERDRLARVVARTGDASDATEEVVREQSRRSVGEVHWHRMRVNRPLDTIVVAARGVLERAR
ncbi:AAA family ATPase [Sphingomonas hengshuiensis]|uniref:Aminoglycoside phosphotransferase n=1 Tax=Sphingomonas hengshuiensis TaxID=1609977 RepID=A0A7U4LFA5_9SPHN|nr:AAA family ATPase [Sphingomonas hengshuiensis]AJP72245.1 aminoglycoside phosphotransferase [Sphingomonas hengshuiensis]